MMSDRGAAWVIYVVLGVWSAAMVASMWPGSDYRMDPIVHGIFSATVVTSLTYRIKKDSDTRPPSGSHKR